MDRVCKGLRTTDPRVSAGVREGERGLQRPHVARAAVRVGPPVRAERRPERGRGHLPARLEHPGAERRPVRGARRARRREQHALYVPPRRPADRAIAAPLTRASRRRLQPGAQHHLQGRRALRVPRERADGHGPLPLARLHGAGLPAPRRRRRQLQREDQPAGHLRRRLPVRPAGLGPLRRRHLPADRVIFPLLPPGTTADRAGGTMGAKE